MKDEILLSDNYDSVIKQYETDFENDNVLELELDSLCDRYISDVEYLRNLQYYLVNINNVPFDLIENEFEKAINFILEITELFCLRIRREFFKNPNKLSLILSYVVNICDENINMIKQWVFLGAYVNSESIKLIFDDFIKYLQFSLHSVLKFSPNTIVDNKINFETFFLLESYKNEIIKEKQKSKNNWCLKLRYELLSQSGLIDSLTKSDIKESEKWECISQILGVNIDNARKLYCNTYDKGILTDDEIIRKNYFVELLKNS